MRRAGAIIRRLGAMTLILAGCPAHAAEYAVGPLRQYRSLQAVEALLKPGDVVTVDGGATYAGGVSLDKDGTPGKGVILIQGRAVNGARPILSGVTAPGGTVLRVLGSHYVIEGLDLTAGGDPRVARCFYNVGDDVTLRDSIVHDCPCTGVAGADASGSLTLDRVEVCRCGNGLYAHQIYVGSSLAKYPQALFRMQFCYVHDGTGGNNVKSRVTRNEIVYNWIEAAAFHELDLVGPDPKSQPAPVGGVHCDADIIGNVLIAGPRSAGAIARMGSDGTAASRGRYRFASNTVIIRSKSTVALGAFWLKGEVDSLALWDNAFWSEAGPLRLVRQDAGSAPILAGGGNWMPRGTMAIPPEWRAIIGSDPAFVNAAAADYRPAAGSPLIDAGCIPPQPDLFARAIPPTRDTAQGPVRPAATEKDIGAYPFIRPLNRGE